jgi:two-component sensor histidine kinase
VEAELRPYRNTGTDRVILKGPDVELPSEIAVPLGMALHELTTNAARFGALSVEEGSLEVTWDVLRQQDDVLRIEWVERGGPAVQAPEREGFGSKLIHRALTAQTKAKVAVDFQPNGLKVLIDVPLRASADLFDHPLRNER